MAGRKRKDDEKRDDLMKGKNILEYIPFGKENAVSRKELEKLTGLPDRTIRLMIKQAIRKGNPILSSSSAKGYWRSEDIEEIEAFLRESDHRRNTEAMTVQPLRVYVCRRKQETLIPVKAHYRRIHRPQESVPEGQIKLKI